MKPAKHDYIVGLYKNTRRLKFVVCFVTKSYVVTRCWECTSEPGRIDIEWGISGSGADNVNLFGENLNIMYGQNHRSLICYYKAGGLEEYVEKTQHIFMSLP